MKASFARLLLPSVLAAAALPAPAAARAALLQEEEQAGEVPPIQEEGDFYVLNFSEDPSQALTLEDFVKLCQEATHYNFTYTKDTAEELKKAPVVMLGTKRIAKQDFYAFFQIQMFINEFICIEIGPQRIRLILIQGLSAANKASPGAKPMQRARYIDPDEIEDYEDAPATLITTSLYLPNTEVRQLATTMRAMMPDQNTQGMTAVGDHAVILTGFGSQVASLVKLLTLVDSLGAPEAPVQAVFDVVPLEYAAAADVADLITQLIEAQQSAVPSQSRPRGEGQPQPPVALGAGELEPQVLVDARTNSLLLMALPDEMPRIKDLVARLDVEVLEPERNFHIYDLQHMKAEDLADTLDEFLSGAESLDTAEGGTGGRARPGTTGGGGTSASGSNEVVVVADPDANALLIAANKTRYEEVLDLLRQLDRRQDQVLIETALIELTGKDFRDIGVELAFADVTGDGGFGFSGFGLSTISQDEDGNYIRVPGLPSEGMVGGILSGDDVNLPFLIAAAQRTDGANVLNVPSVLVNNNGGARVTTLDEQPTTTITANNVGGQTQENFRDWESAGITLQISPSISASNYLRLDVSLTVQTFVGTAQASTNRTIPSPRITREIVTTVNVPDGDTMVFGGIITDNLTETTRGVPFLMDLPLVGQLFGRHSRTNTRTTLYFFVTPHILRDRDFADLAEISYAWKQDAARAIGKDRVRVIDPDFDVDPRRLDESFQIPGYNGPPRGEVDDPAQIGLDPQRRAELLRQAREAEDEAGTDDLESGDGTADKDP
ncbi:MAG: secretin N-terminal domain-containing protein [Planctomycetota bacterium]